VIAPAAATRAQLREPAENRYLAAVGGKGGAPVLALAALSTGGFRATEFPGEGAGAKLAEEMESAKPREVLVAPERPTVAPLPSGYGPPPTRTPLDDWVFTEEYGARLVGEQFHVATLAGYGLDGHPLAVAAAGAVLHYVRDSQRSSLLQFDGVRYYEQ